MQPLPSLMKAINAVPNTKAIFTTLFWHSSDDNVRVNFYLYWMAFVNPNVAPCFAICHNTKQFNFICLEFLGVKMYYYSENSKRSIIKIKK